jgi:hypothetical protein
MSAEFALLLVCGGLTAIIHSIWGLLIGSAVRCPSLSELDENDDEFVAGRREDDDDDWVPATPSPLKRAVRVMPLQRRWHL